ncbi:ribonuclease R family protein [Buchnera aphidicola]|uniref:ribonuclease R family protein n=1 Tax=Buchnera aphidicola TaxID=9 RepID=UPI0025B07317|nr:VacB/RNase II family 3'-5' exoribonuclease [Buchnera aphidicola]
MCNQALKKFNIPNFWSNKIIKEINTLKNKTFKNNFKSRKDLRNISFITIDEKDSYDFDDAIYCYKIKNGFQWKLLVAISDVSFYVKKNSFLDKEAFNRGTSIYFPLKVIPMFPEELSTNMFSLLPNQEKFCIICEMTLSNKGDLLSYKHYKAVIRSHARLTYSNVIKLWKKNNFYKKKFSNIRDNLKNLYFLNKILSKNKNLKKMILFQNNEPIFIFDTYFKIKKILTKKKNKAHNLIESCMILANKSTAILLNKYNVFSLFRNHEYPNDIKIKNFRNLLKKFNLILTGGKKPLLNDYFKLFYKIRSKPYKEIIELALLKSTKKAFYSEKNIGHFGLAEKFYTHFTSPIRRYSDLTVHRAVKFFLKNKNKKKLYNINSKKSFSFNLKDFKKIGKKCSITEKRADKAYKFVIEVLKLEYMKKKIGKSFLGIISHITEFGFFVRLNSFFIEGLVHVSQLKDDYYYYNKKNMTLHGKRSKKKFSIGEKVFVKIISIQKRNKTMNLSLL